jgi:hypothetical protein
MTPPPPGGGGGARGGGGEPWGREEGLEADPDGRPSGYGSGLPIHLGLGATCAARM